MGRYKRERAIHMSRNAPVRRELAVIVAGRVAGELREHGDGYISFSYEPGYDGPPLSVALPRDEEVEHLDLQVRPVIEGLLPDNMQVRKEMANEAGLGSADAFSLLGRFGKDLPGAVQVCDMSEVDVVLRREGRYAPVSDTEVANRLVASADMDAPVWHGENETWSLGGNQGKFALALIDGKWMRCEGAYPSTHILKPGVVGMPLQALVEFATMQAASHIGLDVADTSYREFDGVGAIVIERYDRMRTENGIMRIHQEDLCQALGYLPASKYDVTTSDVVKLLQTHTGKASMARFADALMFNYLVGGIDAHAKNLSLLHLGRDAIELAPLYDLASVLPYEKIGMGRWRKTPMSIGGVRNIGALTGADLNRFAETAELPPEAVKDRMRQMASAIPDAISDVGREHSDIRGMERVIQEMSRTVSANCRAMLVNVDRGHADFARPGLDAINSGNLPREHADSDAVGVPGAERIIDAPTGIGAHRKATISEELATTLETDANEVDGDRRPDATRTPE